MRDGGLVTVVDDLVAESAALDQLLADLADDRWLAPTPAAGWDVRDSVTHLAASNELALDCVVEGRSTLIDEVLAAGDITEFERRHLAPGRARSGPDVRRWWQESTERLASVLRTKDGRDRFPWGPNVMSAASFTTARLMETWAHGLDCFAAVDRQPVDTERLRHVAYLSLRSLPFAFALHKLPPPGPVRLELAAPDGSCWRLGPDDAPTWVEGTAGDWCRVAVHRDRRGERERLRARGPDGNAVVGHVQAYLGV